MVKFGFDLLVAIKEHSPKKPHPLKVPVRHNIPRHPISSGVFFIEVNMASSKIKRQCLTCGKEFEVYRSSLEKSNSSGKFCCRKCYNEYQKTLVKEKNNHCTGWFDKCPNCGKDVWRIPSRAKVYKNRFCSPKCKHEYHHNYVEGEKNCNWKGGYSSFRGSDFERVKKRYFQNSICALCGSSEHIHIHHIIPYRLTKDNRRQNLVPLCSKHHKKIEDIFVKNVEELGDYELSRLIFRNILDTYLLAQYARLRRIKDE